MTVITPRKIKGFGCHVSLPDSRDYGLDRLSAFPQPRRRLPASVDLRTTGKLPPVKDQGQLGCHDEQTEVLTERGWQRWPEYDQTSRLGTLNPSTHALEFQAPVAVQAYDYDGPLYYTDHRALDFAITPNHRMLVRRWSESARTLSPAFGFTQMESLGWYAGLPAAPSGFHGIEVARAQVGRRDMSGDDFVALVALVLSDGWVGGTEHNRNTVSFCCFRDDRREMVAALAHRIGFGEIPGRRGVWKANDPDLACWFRDHAFTGTRYRSPFKRIPDIVKNASQRQLVLFLRFFGDQHVGTNRQFYSTSRRLIDDLQEVLLRIGSRASIYERPMRAGTFPDGRRTNPADGAMDITLTERKTDRLSLARKRQVGQDRYHGPVFCATVPNGTLVTRRNGSVLISGNSCTGNGLATQLEYAEAVKGEPFVPKSRLWIYYEERVIEGTTDQDAGAAPRDGLEVLRKLGCPPETDWPYDIAKFATKPPDLSADAAKNKVITYVSVPARATTLKQLLAAGYCIGIGFTAYESLLSQEVAQTGMLPMPSPGEAVVGGHFVVICGYGMIGGGLYFTCQNSWGLQWGNKGFFYMPVLYATGRNAFDRWAIEIVS